MADNDWESGSPAAKSLEEEILEALDLKSWSPGPDLEALYQRLSQQVGDAVHHETRAIQYLREEFFPRIEESWQEALSYKSFGGFHSGWVRQAHQGLLFNGGVEAVDGIMAHHDTLPLSVAQIGVCMVSYRGQLGTYSHQLFKKDLRVRGEDPIEEVKSLLEERINQSGQMAGKDPMTRLARKGLMAFAERRILGQKATSSWRMGHGNPIPIELLSSYWANQKELRDAALEVMQTLVDHERFVFVASKPRRLAWMTLGNALKPMEYILLDTVQQDLKETLRKSRGFQDSTIERFIEEYGNKVVFGLYRATPLSPAYMFYSHRDFAHKAALIAIADGMLHEHRGFPMLLDLAANICKSTFNPEAFQTMVEQTFAKEGQPFRYPG